jgi:hypothetical protein
MPRALTIQRSIIPAHDREQQLKRLAAKRDHYRGMQCRYWVFEERAVRGAFVEFIEADSADAIVRAHAAATDPPVDAGRIYLEVELA